MITKFSFQHNIFLCCYWLVSLLSHLLTYTQVIKFLGQIMDSDGRTIPRVNGVIKGTLIDTIADSDDALTLDAKDEIHHLFFLLLMSQLRR